jgi:hypothetical protein
MAVDLPEQIGRYRILAVLGTGGFATVYRAVDERLDAIVAVKVLAENHSHDPDLRERFLKEGQVLRRIDGPHVVTVHDLGETERGQPYLVLDHADRGNLSERVATRRAAGWRPATGDVLHVAEAVADALAAVHASDLVHRDVAPRNLLVRSERVAGTRTGSALVAADERLLLADLGLSKDLASASGLTVGGGTAGYTPPEQRTGMVKVDAAADIWAASALLVWLVSDRPPDDDGRWRADLLAAGWSEAVVGAIARGLAWAPSDRYSSAPAWFDAIRQAMTPAIAATPPAATEIAASPPAAPSHTRNPTWTWLVAAGLLGAALGAGTLQLVGGNDDDNSPVPSEQTETDLPGGDVRVEAASGDLEVAIVGPREVDVGEDAVFEAEAPDADRLVWFGPDGQVHPDENRLAVEASSPGAAYVTLAGVDSDGRTVTATHTLTVIDD